MTLSHEDIRKERQALHLTIKQAIERLAVLDQMEQELPAETVRTEQIDIDVSKFRDTTRRLLVELLDAEDHMIYTEDIREDVILDKDASDGAVRLVIFKARNEMKSCDECHYEIRNTKGRDGKGYKLVDKKVFPSVSKVPKIPKKMKKKRGNS